MIYLWIIVYLIGVIITLHFFGCAKESTSLSKIEYLISLTSWFVVLSIFVAAGLLFIKSKITS